ncbi:MAG TPA: RelA/SpoT family protein [bacterium]|nr:RelA/SpoT family protein [bacterium]HQE63049.1 RelA/SpoT family protein [bacterium]HQI94527.1 RelA/SpoT family protein [bacterium]
MTINQVIAQARNYLSENDIALIKSAYNFAAQAHRGQKRITGEPYLEHPLQTAFILAQMGLDAKTIAAGLLHDVPEDTKYKLADIKKIFGEDIAFLVDSVTKLSNLEYHGQIRYREGLKKMFLAMAKDIRVIFIKFADRLHNLRTLEYLPDTKRQSIANETLDIYVPIADLLGIWHLKWQMEDLCFKYLHPAEYQELSQKYQVDKKLELNQYIKRMTKELGQALDKLNIPHEINGRFKHLYSIWQKMQDKNRKFNEIYDVFALRVIVPDIDSCYRTLGVIHNLWRPNMSRFKDYIALPKPNGYQSLHTTVFGPEGKATEFQIRTPEIHEQAQYGMAAYWSYKKYGSKRPAPHVGWIQEILNAQKNSPDTKTFIQQLRLDIFNDRLFVLSPKGDVYELPTGSTPIDFAYAVHTDIGNKAKGVLINNKIGQLDELLHNNDIVEIIIDKQQTAPDPAWLKFVKTTKAKNSIKQYLKPSPVNRLLNLANPQHWWPQHPSQKPSAKKNKDH